jgi:putative ABC transport system permease protein
MVQRPVAMSVRERTREVAVLRTLGFTRARVLALFVSEAVTLAVAGGLLGALAASGLKGLAWSRARQQGRASCLG